MEETFEIEEDFVPIEPVFFKDATIIIDLSCFLVRTTHQLGQLPSDRHADVQLPGARLHTRPYFEDFLLQMCLNTNFSLVFALNLPLTSLIAYIQYLVNGKPGLKCLKGRIAALWSHSHFQDGKLMTKAVGRSLLVTED